MKYLLLPLLFLFCIDTTFAANKLISYRNDNFNYGIAYPANWETSNQSSVMQNNVFSIINKDAVNVNVAAKLLGNDNRGKYNNITDVPNIRHEMKKLAESQIGCKVLGSGYTTLSNRKAIWQKTVYHHKSLNQEVVIVVYQVQALKNDVIYTLTAKVASINEVSANRKFNKYWNEMKNIMITFSIDP